MIVQRIVTATAAIGAMAAAAGVVIVAAAFAVYSLLRDYLGPSGAAAVIAVVFAIVLAGLAMVLLRGKPDKALAKHPVDTTMPERMLDMVRQRPLLGAGAAVAAGLLAWRNPNLVSTLLRFMEPRAQRERT